MARANDTSGKAEDAFRTISEVADELGVPQHVLRFWETKFNQIKPLKRAGGRRFYRPDDIDLLRGIQHYLHVQGYTIKGLQKILRQSGQRVASDLGRNLALGRRVEARGPAADPADGDQTQLELSGMTAAQRSSLQETLNNLNKLRDDLQSVAD